MKRKDKKPKSWHIQAIHSDYDQLVTHVRIRDFTGKRPGESQFDKGVPTAPKGRAPQARIEKPLEGEEKPLRTTHKRLGYKKKNNGALGWRGSVFSC